MTWHRSRKLPRRLSATLLLAGTVLVAGCDEQPPSSAAPIEVRSEFGGVGIDPGHFSYPRGLDTMRLPDGRSVAVVVDKSARIQLLDTSTGGAVGGLRTPAWDLGKPTGLCVGLHPDPAKRDEPVLWVPDTHYHRVLVYELSQFHVQPAGDNEAEPITIEPTEPAYQFGAFGDEPGQFVYPTDVAMAPNDDGSLRVYVSEYGGNDRVQVFRVAVEDDAFTAEPIKAIGVFGLADEDTPDAPVHFNRPQSLAFDASAGVDGELIVTDACNHRVGRFTREGELVTWFDGKEEQSSAEGEQPIGELRYPYGLALLSHRQALICEYGGHRVRLMDLQTGDTLGVYGEPGRGPGQLASPWAVGVVGRSALVLDSGNNRVLLFRAPGEALVSHTGGGAP